MDKVKCPCCKFPSDFKTVVKGKEEDGGAKFFLCSYCGVKFYVIPPT